MRDAFGGTFLISVFLVFILIYISFTALSLNYAKAFKVKNAVIDYLENSEIIDLSNLTANQINMMDQYFQDEVLGYHNYNLSSMDLCNSNGGDSKLLTNAEGKTIGYCHNSGVLIVQSNIDKTGNTIKGNTEGVYYTVSTYVGWSLPFLNNLLKLNGNSKQEEAPTGMWEISGQTRLIVNE